MPSVFSIPLDQASLQGSLERGGQAETAAIDAHALRTIQSAAGRLQLQQLRQQINDINATESAGKRLGKVPTATSGYYNSLAEQLMKDGNYRAATQAAEKAHGIEKDTADLVYKLSSATYQNALADKTKNENPLTSVMKNSDSLGKLAILIAHPELAGQEASDYAKQLFEAKKSKLLHSSGAKTTIQDLLVPIAAQVGLKGASSLTENQKDVIQYFAQYDPLKTFVSNTFRDLGTNGKPPPSAPKGADVIDTGGGVTMTKSALQGELDKTFPGTNITVDQINKLAADNKLTVSQVIQKLQEEQKKVSQPTP